MPALLAARVVQTILIGLISASLFATIQPTPEDGRNAVALLVLSAIFLSSVGRRLPGLPAGSLHRPLL